MKDNHKIISLIWEIYIIKLVKQIGKINNKISLRFTKSYADYQKERGKSNSSIGEGWLWCIGNGPGKFYSYIKTSAIIINIYIFYNINLYNNTTILRTQKLIPLLSHFPYMKLTPTPIWFPEPTKSDPWVKSRVYPWKQPLHQTKTYYTFYRR